MEGQHIDFGTRPWMERWARPECRSYPDADVESLVAALWPDDRFSDVFQIKAGYLLAARVEDDLALPRGCDDPLFAELTAMVLADLKSNGLLDRL